MRHITKKLVATRTAEEATLVVGDASNSSKLPLSRLTAPFAGAPLWSKIN